MSSDSPSSPSSADESVIDRARAWLAHDPDPETRTELEGLIEAGGDALAERFAGPLVFGTAGLRGVLGAGESRMNRAVVIRTSAGLAAHLLEHVEGAREKGVVVGYDGRRGSRQFAEDAAAVFTAAGLPTRLSVRECPTPIVAYGVRHHGAAAGVMVTASHNPPEYNGYKVYAENGAQIIPPTDASIASCIDAAPPADEVPRRSLDGARADGLLTDLSDALDEAYLAAIAALVPAAGDRDRSLPIAYTPLHGVGARLLEIAMRRAGFERLATVASQREPDGSFPTVRFPNPEEDGAMDAVVALATEHDAPIAIANDPDADRLAVAVRTAKGVYRQLTGNEVGVLLGHHEMSRSEGPRMVIASLVSSPQLGVIAEAMGVRYEETLTGFKWIANRALEVEGDTGERFVFGYEEALGYTVGTVARDKDGIGAALVLASLAAELLAEGETLVDRLDALSRAHGLFASKQRSLKFAGASGAARMAALMDALRSDAPSAIAELAVHTVTDHARGERRTGDTVTALTTPRSNVLVYDLDGGQRVIVRPSGTEPKIKIYCDVRVALAEGDAIEAASATATKLIERLEGAMVERLSDGA